MEWAGKKEKLAYEVHRRIKGVRKDSHLPSGSAHVPCRRRRRRRKRGCCMVKVVRP